MIPHKLLMGSLVVAMILGGCVPVPSGAVTLTETDAGGLVELRVGQILEVVLPGNPTTGYNWEVSALDEDILRLVGEPQFKPNSSALGAGGQITLRFQAVVAGTTQLALAYRRPWEKGTPPAETFAATIVVRE